jgi:hypothetical protein
MLKMQEKILMTLKNSRCVKATHEEWDAFRASTDATITANENRILDLKARMKNTGVVRLIPNTLERIAVLEQKKRHESKD